MLVANSIAASGLLTRTSLTAADLKSVVMMMDNQFCSFCT